MYRTVTYFFSSSPLLSSSHLLTFSLLSSIPFFPFPSVSFPNSCRYICILSFPLSVIFPFLHFSPFPFFFSFLSPSSSLSLLFTFSFPSPLPFQPPFFLFLPFPLLPLRLLSQFIFSSTVIHGNYPELGKF